ncbi:MAG: lytic transglycosylase domain-containing protein [Sediminimonas sp.]|uniref:Lytic transglycosylase domain-containing protein n=2 Tax=Roseobacteraceae TaxID=2854170 RepID=A0A7C9HAR0_9RHOB|nr:MULTISPECIES: lytic transglycosylase domain-containing protein [Sediminimonas]MDR9485263.1 lytic transglycosylase domain-containing protein [Sediminimonas sp.]MTJ04511.1 lytic transglycosylase domain-containing protein [Sediminimonas qiaohouensis]
MPATCLSRRAVLIALLMAPAACSVREPQGAVSSTRSTPLYPNETPELRALIKKYARKYDVPVSLVQRVVVRESTHRPHARNGPYYGLMQILPQTARTMGYRGSPEGLLDAETNLKYAVKYLRGAWLVSDGDQDAAVMWYARGYYYEAKKRGMLRETGLRG